MEKFLTFLLIVFSAFEAYAAIYTDSHPLSKEVLFNKEVIIAAKKDSAVYSGPAELFYLDGQC